jgi:hypothetical protein
VCSSSWNRPLGK